MHLSRQQIDKNTEYWVTRFKEDIERYKNMSDTELEPWVREKLIEAAQSMVDDLERELNGEYYYG